MPKDWKLSLRRGAAAAAVVLVFAATWAVLDRSEHRPRWLVVEAPSAAVIGQPFEVRVKLKEPIGPTRMVCFLNWFGSDRRLRVHNDSYSPEFETPGGETHLFRFEAPDDEELVYVSAFIYLSPTGKWEDRTRAADTRLTRVRRYSPAGGRQVLKKLRIYQSSSAAEDAAAQAGAEAIPPELRQETSSWDHPILFIILLASAFLCRAKAGRKRFDAQGYEKRERTVWLLFAAVLTVSAVFELCSLAGPIMAWARRLAQQQNIYEIRETYQKSIMAAVAASALGLFFLFIRATRRPGMHRFLWWAGMGLAAYLAVSFVSVLSFHAVDVVRGMTWRGVSLIDAARGAGALVAFLAAILALRQNKEGRPT